MKLPGIFTGRFKPNLAGRIVLLACVVAVLAAIAQWAATPFLLRNEVQHQRVYAVEAAISTLSEIASVGVAHGNNDDFNKIVGTLSNSLPHGYAALFQPDGTLIAEAGGEGGTADFEAHLKSLNAVHAFNGRYAMMREIVHDDFLMGYAVYSFRPRSVREILSALMLANSVGLILALFVLAPLFLPVARRVLAPVTRLEKRVRARDENDRSKLADGEEDTLLKPLLIAIDEVNQRSIESTQRAMRLAYVDAITGLPNRLHLMSLLDDLLAAEEPEPVYFIIGDLDGFGRLNVSLGPRIADEILSVIGKRLSVCAEQFGNPELFVGRLGADKFGIIATSSDRDRVQKFMAAASKSISAPIGIQGVNHRVAASFGAAHAPEDATHAADLIKQAEVALNEAKRPAGPSEVLFNNSLLEVARKRSQLETSLREGVERGEFVPVFQPKVELETGELVGAEALARWQRPDGTVVSPGVFIPIAEELGLIVELGKSILMQACQAAAIWNTGDRKVRIAVNVSPFQFDDPSFLDTVDLALKESGLDPRLLELEITESSAVQNPDRVAKLMWPLRNRGIRFAIDDFGTGHSNFASITRLPFDVFKIDQQFIRGLADDPAAPSIVEMILAMAEALGQETVAEGIETREQADFLLNRACTIGQGYYFSPPLPSEEFDAFMRSWRPRHATKFVA